MSVIDLGQKFNLGWKTIYSSNDTYEFYKKHEILRNAKIKSKTKVGDEVYDTAFNRYNILVKAKDFDRAKQILDIK
ncbi:MAG: hypothetical protein N2Z65_03885 [Clostridiales bacterium]|nr:hypothetical protein [Clostridiales bacterium]